MMPFTGLFGRGDKRRREEQITQIVLDFVLASTDREIEALMAAHRDELMSDAANRVFKRLLKESKNDTALTQIIRDRRALLTHQAISMNPDLIPDWVRAQNERAADYLARAHAAVHGARADNLTKAIDLYVETLDQLDPETWPQEWAITNFKLAQAYWTDMPGDRGIVSRVFRDRAIVHFYAALMVWTRDSYPAEWAETQVNLGLTFLSRRRGDQWDNIEDAIQHFKNALTVITRKASPEQWALVQTGLGAAYLERIVQGQIADNIEQAIAHFQNALRVRNRAVFPAEWATTQFYLGKAYLARTRGKRADNIEQAINCLQLALEDHTLETIPLKWLLVQTYLGDAYASRVRGKRKENVKWAIAAYRQALKGQSLEETPTQSRMIQSKLGDLYFAEQRWAEADSAYGPALSATEMLYQQGGTTPAARDFLLQHYGNLPVNAAYCLARLGHFHKAVETVENGKARALGEALERNEAILEFASAQDRTAFTAARQRIAVLETQARAVHEQSPSDARLANAWRQGALDATAVREIFAALKAQADDGQEPPRDALTLTAGLLQAREELDAIAARIRGYAPQFMPVRPDFAEIARVASALACPLVYLLTTPAGSLALIVVPGVKTLAKQHVVWLNDFKTTDLNQTLYQREDQLFYLDAIAGGGSATGLIQVLDKIWPVLDARLMGPIAQRLVQLGYQRAVLIATTALGLFPLPAIAFEKVTLTYAFSARTLRPASKEAHAGLAPVLLGIGNPLPNPQPLVFARTEVEEIGSLFAARARRLLCERRATRAAVLKALPGATHLHFACHGTFDVASALDSALFLSGNDTLTLRDLLDGGLDLSAARLAVLSACQTGITDFFKVPEEMVGFPAGFLQAGVPGVVSALWPVADISTALLLTRFYHYHLKDGRDPAMALYLAQGWLRAVTAQEMGLADYYQRLYQESGQKDQDAFRAMRYYRANPSVKPFAHPYYWAGFVFSGV